MRCLIFVPEKGVPVQQFGVWMDLRNLNRIDSLAAATGKCAMTIKDALKKLEEEKLIFRSHQGAGKPSRIYVQVQTENCLSDGQNPVPGTDRKLSISNNYSNSNTKRTRNYDYEEGESL